MYARFFLVLLWLGLAIILVKLAKGLYKTWTTPIAEGESKINGGLFFLTLMMFAFVALVSLITHGMAKVKLGQLATTIFLITYVVAFTLEHIIAKRNLVKADEKLHEITKPTPVWQSTLSYIFGIFLLPTFFLVHDSSNHEGAMKTLSKRY